MNWLKWLRSTAIWGFLSLPGKWGTLPLSMLWTMILKVFLKICVQLVLIGFSISWPDTESCPSNMPQTSQYTGEFKQSNISSLVWWIWRGDQTTQNRWSGYRPGILMNMAQQWCSEVLQGQLESKGSQATLKTVWEKSLQVYNADICKCSWICPSPMGEVCTLSSTYLVLDMQLSIVPSRHWGKVFKEGRLLHSLQCGLGKSND